SAAATFVQEVQLRCSPLQLALIQVGAPAESLSFLDPYVACRAQWPHQMEAVTDLLRAAPTVTAKKKPLTEVIANRLKMHTPSLLPQASRLALAAAHDITVLLTG